MAKSSPMYQAFVEVVPEASGFTGALTGQVTTASAAAGAAGGKAAAGGIVAGLGKAIPLIGAGIAAIGLGDLISNAINDGANYQQAVGAVEDVFGSASQTIIDFSKTSGKQFGLSANQALSGAKDFGIFGQAAGLTGDDLAGFSTDLLGLAADLSAFANTTPEEAVMALGAGLRGESEPLRKYGVLLDDATLKARALEMGIYDGEGALTQQQRILAASAEIFAQTGIQQGKFADEADTLAGKQAILAASWEDISTQIGTAFLPIAQELVDMIVDDVVPALEDFAAWLQKPETQEGIANFASSLREVGNFLRDYVANPITDTVGMVQGFVSIFNGVSFEEFKTKMTELPGFWGMVFRAGEDVATALGGQVGSMIFNVRQFASEVGANIGRAVEWFRNLPGQIGQAVSGAGQWLYSAGRDVIRGFINGITSMVTNIYTAITDTVGGAIDWAKDLLGIASPSKVFRQLGEYTGEGFAQGIESQYRNVAAATSGMTGAATGAVGDTYVQNPFTGEYLLAQVSRAAGAVVSARDAAAARVARGRMQTA